MWIRILVESSNVKNQLPLVMILTAADPEGAEVYTENADLVE